MFLLSPTDTETINSIGVSLLIGMLEKTMETGGRIAFCHCAAIVERRDNCFNGMIWIFGE